jgi:hypothetical protein
MSPEPMHSYIPHLHDDGMPTQDLSIVPTSGWYGPSAPAHDQNQVCKPWDPDLMPLTRPLPRQVFRNLVTTSLI